ncbi:Smr domain protein [Talaromyces proteolyticus]|uniref:Smr domain protein n=1 Tax=Talaromyces proteolyticus TaxID=1131652 RepID=A0AAD4L4Q8_9EURO|nr:Smr domain protein [Talaromyces proteolyticus]KAH8705001.1 Smr domain protein [Talaromyces proteolyticus]
MVDSTTKLQVRTRKYLLPPLDSALFSAIVSDYDLADCESLKQLEDILDALKATADEQQDLPFDPSGTGGLSAADLVDNDGSTSRNDTSGSRETDITSLRSDLSSLVIDSETARTSNIKSYIIDSNGMPSLTGMTVEEKIGYLSEMFPSVAQFTIKHTLTKCDGDVDRSMDLLLNIAFFDSQESQSPVDEDARISIPKGIDGFVSPQNGRKKGKNRKAKTRAPAGFSSLDSPESPIRNKWDDAKEDLDFICSRTSSVLRRETVSSAYHQNHASLPETIRFLAAANTLKTGSNDEVLVAQVAELVQDFPTISIPILEGLLSITAHSTSAANELARATLAQPSRQASDIVRIAAPAPILDDEEERPARPSAALPRIPLEYNSAQTIANSHFAAGSTAFVKASAAYRRGKSDRLMGGAAAYYASVGREHLEKAKREASAAADALVNAQSTVDSLDLHGVSVQDGVRIASDRVSRWWESLGDTKYAVGGSAQGPYRIITGAGRHSRDGTSRLGPAVGKMLATEGWKVEVADGVLIVTGKSRRR